MEEHFPKRANPGATDPCARSRPAGAGLPSGQEAPRADIHADHHTLTPATETASPGNRQRGERVTLSRANVELIED